MEKERSNNDHPRKGGDEKKPKAFLKEQKTMLEEIAEEESEKEAESDNNG